MIASLRARYLDLVRDCLTGLVYDDPPLAMTEDGGMRPFDRRMREAGLDWPSHAHSMIGRKRMAQLQHAVEAVIEQGIPGDFIETGVWRGGACILMRAVLQAWDVRDRRVFVADSFAGLPPPDAETYPADADAAFHRYAALAVSADEVRANFERYHLLDDQVVFLEGWFRDTLPAAAIDRLAILRLDGDLYESTFVALSSLYGKVSLGGYIIVDDYNVIPNCRAAVTDFRREHGITDPIRDIDGSGVYWRREAA